MARKATLSRRSTEITCRRLCPKIKPNIIMRISMEDKKLNSMITEDKRLLTMRGATISMETEPLVTSSRKADLEEELATIKLWTAMGCLQVREWLEVQ